MTIEKLGPKMTIVKGDLLLIVEEIRGANVVRAYIVKDVKQVLGDTEIILDVRKNVWFSWGKYVIGKSWVKEVWRQQV